MSGIGFTKCIQFTYLFIDITPPPLVPAVRHLMYDCLPLTDTQTVYIIVEPKNSLSVKMVRKFAKQEFT